MGGRCRRPLCRGDDGHPVLTTTANQQQQQQQQSHANSTKVAIKRIQPRLLKWLLAIY